MTTKADIKLALEDVTHASQTKGVVAMLLGYLAEAGVESPDEAKARKEQEMNEQRHRELAEASTVEQVDELANGWAADEDTDDDLRRAAAERRALLADQEQADADEQKANGSLIETGDYSAWDKPKLQAQLRARELPVSGTKEELAARLVKDDEKRQADADAATGETPEAEQGNQQLSE